MSVRLNLFGQKFIGHNSEVISNTAPIVCKAAGNDVFQDALALLTPNGTTNLITPCTRTTLAITESMTSHLFEKNVAGTGFTRQDLGVPGPISVGYIVSFLANADAAGTLQRTLNVSVNAVVKNAHGVEEPSVKAAAYSRVIQGVVSVPNGATLNFDLVATGAGGASGLSGLQIKLFCQ